MMRLPSAETATAVTASSTWTMGAAGWPVADFQMRIDLSADAETTSLPSALSATAESANAWFLSTALGAAGDPTSQIIAVASADAVTTKLPSPLMATPDTG